MPTINGKACVVNGMPVDKVFSNGNQVYGRNLVTGTSNELKTVTISGWGNSPFYYASKTYGAGRYYASAYVENTTPIDMKMYVSIYEGPNFVYNAFGEIIPAGQSGIVSCTTDILEGRRFYSAFIGFAYKQTESYTYKYKEVMVKREPRPWTPAPEDVM